MTNSQRSTLKSQLSTLNSQGTTINAEPAEPAEQMLFGGLRELGVEPRKLVQQLRIGTGLRVEP
jgi:hypothetical protein